MSRPRQEPLFGATTNDGKVGPVYQGVCAQIRALFPKDDADAQARKALLAGTIAQARSTAASIDRVSGHAGYQAAGMQLAALHHQLDELLERLAPDAGDDPFEAWLKTLGPEAQETTGGDAQVPHST